MANVLSTKSAPKNKCLFFLRILICLYFEYKCLISFSIFYGIISTTLVSGEEKIKFTNPEPCGEIILFAD